MKTIFDIDTIKTGWWNKKIITMKSGERFIFDEIEKITSPLVEDTPVSKKIFEQAKMYMDAKCPVTIVAPTYSIYSGLRARGKAREVNCYIQGMHEFSSLCPDRERLTLDVYYFNRQSGLVFCDEVESIKPYYPGDDKVEI